MSAPPQLRRFDRLCAVFGYDAEVLAQLPPLARFRVGRAALAGIVPVVACAGSAAYASMLMGAALWICAVAAPAAALLVWTFLRCLNAGTGYSLQLPPEGLARWRPGPVPVLLSMALGGLLLQPLALIAAGDVVPQTIEAEKHRLTELHVRGVTSLLVHQRGAVEREMSEVARRIDAERTQLGTLESELKELALSKEAAGKAAFEAETKQALIEARRRLDAAMKEGARLSERRAALTEEIDGLSASERARYQQRLAGSGFLGLRLGILWDTPTFAGFLTWLFAMLFALPSLLRAISTKELRAYESALHEAHRAFALSSWAEARSRAEALLKPFPSFEGFAPSPFADPPFNTQPLLLGRERGVVRIPPGVKKAKAG